MYLHKGSWGHLGSNRRGWQIIGKGEEEKEVGAKETFVPCHILLRRRQTIRNGGFVCRVNRVGRMSIKIQRSNVSMDWWHLDGHRGHNTWWKIYFHLHYYFKIIKINHTCPSVEGPSELPSSSLFPVSNSSTSSQSFCLSLFYRNEDRFWIPSTLE